jgi:hypothetical protein
MSEMVKKGRWINTHKVIVLAAHLLGFALVTIALRGTILANEFVLILEHAGDTVVVVVVVSQQIQTGENALELRVLVVRPVDLIATHLSADVAVIGVLRTIVGLSKRGRGLWAPTRRARELWGARIVLLLDLLLFRMFLLRILVLGVLLLLRVLLVLRTRLLSVGFRIRLVGSILGGRVG